MERANRLESHVTRPGIFIFGKGHHCRYDLVLDVIERIYIRDKNEAVEEAADVFLYHSVLVLEASKAIQRLVEHLR